MPATSFGSAFLLLLYHLGILEKPNDGPTLKIPKMNEILNRKKFPLIDYILAHFFTNPTNLLNATKNLPKNIINCEPTLLSNIHIATQWDYFPSEEEIIKELQKYKCPKQCAHIFKIESPKELIMENINNNTFNLSKAAYWSTTVGVILNSMRCGFSSIVIQTAYKLIAEFDANVEIQTDSNKVLYEILQHKAKNPQNCDKEHLSELVVLPYVKEGIIDCKLFSSSQQALLAINSKISENGIDLRGKNSIDIYAIETIREEKLLFEAKKNSSWQCSP